ncbi:MAG TPA: acyl-CoA dehydrogenase family protein, partial [Acidimicrobiales bacterium]|nr:acyl-CoA dehydrogenase family protein [Acidimicrobiales bacterium]
MDFSPSPEQEMLREAVAKVASGFGHEYFHEKAVSGEKAEELWTALGDAGYLGVNVPAEYGGGGMGISELAIVCEEVAAAGCPLLLILVSPAICASVIAKYGSEGLKSLFLPRFATGELKMAFAITEPDAGSNSHKIATTATRDGDEWVLKGTKYYISGMDEAEAVLVVTRSGTDPDTGRASLSLFVVDTDAPGLTSTHIPVEICAPEKQFTVFFDDVRVPADRLVGVADEGLRQVFLGLNPERIMSAAVSNGIGRYALDKAASYARDRRVWDVPIGAHQGLAHPLAKCKVEV